MVEEKELAKKIIERFRARPEWTPNHCDMTFGETTIGYYDTKDKDGYFSLKFDGIEFTPYSRCDDYIIVFQKGKRQSTFDLMTWLRQLDVLTNTKPVTVIIDGIEYQPKEK